MQEKVKTCWNLNLKDFRRSSFGEYLNTRILSGTSLTRTNFTRTKLTGALEENASGWP